MRTVRFGVLLAIALVACGGRRQGFDPSEPRPLRSARLAFAAADTTATATTQLEALWKRRDEPETRRQLIAVYEQLATPDRAKDVYPHRVRLARLYHLEGELLTEKDDRLRAYESGMTWGDKALATFPAFRERFAATGSVEESVLALDQTAIEGIYWCAVNIGKWAKTTGITKALFYKDRVLRMIERVRELQPSFFYGAADRYMGAYYAALPSIGGQDLARSQTHFEAALAAAPDYLSTRVLFAEYLAVAKDDAKLYRAMLQFVITAPTDRPADVAPEQRLAQAQAKRMLAEIEDRFDLEAVDETQNPDADGE